MMRILDLMLTDLLRFGMSPSSTDHAGQSHGSLRAGVGWIQLATLSAVSNNDLIVLSQ